jgi:hypothetical protein
MIRQLRRWLPLRKLVVVADSTYAALDLLACVSSMIEPVAIVTRLRLDAALYGPAPVRKPGTNGRPRKKGARQPTLAARLDHSETIWQCLSVAWYGGTTRTVELANGTAVWYHAGLPPVAIRWVLIRDPQGKFESQVLLCTDQQASAQAILEWFVLRWQIEVTFHEVRAHLGVETQRQWSDLTILRTTPALLALFSSSHGLCSSVAPGSVSSCTSGRLVYQSASDFLGYAGLCSSTSLACDTFLSVTASATSLCHRRMLSGSL